MNRNEFSCLFYKMTFKPKMKASWFVTTLLEGQLRIARGGNLISVILRARSELVITRCPFPLTHLWIFQPLIPQPHIYTEHIATLCVTLLWYKLRVRVPSNYSKI